MPENIFIRHNIILSYYYSETYIVFTNNYFYFCFVIFRLNIK